VSLRLEDLVHIQITAQAVLKQSNNELWSLMKLLRDEIRGRVYQNCVKKLTMSYVCCEHTKNLSQE